MEHYRAATKARKLSTAEAVGTAAVGRVIYALTPRAQGGRKRIVVVCHAISS